ncbi:MAG: hypothetical protein JXQ75_17365 [Phycisphaerae bacterium]|nr:hypothetical protein [Phycisphaerae bacterium]
MVRSWRCLAFSLVLICGGCVTTTRWELDLTKIEGFDASKWDGKVRVTCCDGELFGRWKVDGIELKDHDGNVVLLEHHGGTVRAFEEVEVERIPLREQTAVGESG